MKHTLSILISFLAFTMLNAQENPTSAKRMADKGVTPLSPSTVNGQPSTATRAVVVGISDYQDPAIPDLRFADRDATAFAAWLQSPAGSSLPPENIKLLTNSAATTGAIAAAMDWLIADCKPGDRAIIYFSGHGDVETRTRFQRGFLLTYDSPPSNYLAGAFALIFLQDIITTLSEQGVQVVMISDACRAGKLAGSDIGGAQATATNLSKQFANEIKILSCQPDEFSLEGEQWGGGRGCFSYHLIEGLTGMADGNADKQVNLLEIGQYLQTKVPAETDPQSQIPLTVGSMKTVLVDVDEASLAALREQKGKTLPAIATIETKGFEQVVLADIDSSWQKKYKQFTAALEKGELLEPAGASAYDLYLELAEVPELERLHGIMKRNLATALQDESQQAINAYLRSDEEELADMSKGDLKYTKFVRYLEKAAELLGSDHYMYRTLKAKQHYFDAVDIRVRFADRTYSLVDSNLIWRAQCEDELRKAVNWEANAAYIYNELYLVTSGEQKLGYLQKALEIAPNWVQLYCNLGHYFIDQKQYEKADSVLQIALRLAPSFSGAYRVYGKLYFNQNKFAQAEPMYRKAIELSPDNVEYMKVLGNIFMRQKRYEEAEDILLQVLEISPDDNDAYNRLSDHHLLHTFEFEKAEAINRKRLEKRPTDGDGYADLASTCWASGDLRKIVPLIAKMERLNDSITNWEGKSIIGYAYKLIGRPDKSIPYFQQAIQAAPASPWSYFQLAGSFKRLGDYEGFLANLDMSFSKGMSYGWVEIMYEFRQANQTPGFRSFAQKVIAHNPEIGFGYRLMALYYEGQGDYRMALGLYQKATELSPAVTDTWFDYAVCAYLNGDHEKADSLFRQMLATAPTSLYNYNHIGLFYKNSGAYALAEQYFRQCIETQKNYYAPYMNLALLYHAQDEHKKCMDVLQQGLAEVPNSQQLQEMSITFSYFANPRKKARQVFERAAESQPEFLLVWDFLEQMHKQAYGEAIQTWQKFGEEWRPWYLAHLYLGALIQQGKTAEALGMLDYRYFSPLNYHLLTTHPLISPIRNEPAYLEYLHRHYPERELDE